MRIPIVLSTDLKYLIPTGVTIRSLINSGEEYDIFVLCEGDVSESDKALIKTEVSLKSPQSKIDFISLSGAFKNSYLERHLSYATYGRLLIPWLLPEHDKIIYCDSDMIFNIKLGDVFDKVTLEKNYCAGVRIQFDNKNEGLYNSIKKIGLNPSNYINAGFLIINSNAIRNNVMLDNFIEMSSGRFTYMDQDIINLMFENKIEYIEQKYNIPDYRMTSDYLKHEYAIHYVGAKPWNTFKPCWIEWWKVYKETHFYNPEYYLDISKKIFDRVRMGEYPQKEPFPILLKRMLKKLLRLG